MSYPCCLSFPPRDSSPFLILASFHLYSCTCASLPALHSYKPLLTRRRSTSYFVFPRSSISLVERLNGLVIEPRPISSSFARNRYGRPERRSMVYLLSLSYPFELSVVFSYGRATVSRDECAFAALNARLSNSGSYLDYVLLLSSESHPGPLRVYSTSTTSERSYLKLLSSRLSRFFFGLGLAPPAHHTRPYMI